MIGANDHFVGNGHGSQIIQDDAGQDWLLYHGFFKINSGERTYSVVGPDQVGPRRLALRRGSDLLLTKHKKHLYLITDFQINQL